jgi:Ni/Co efflux regulator RcnB
MKRFYLTSISAGVALALMGSPLAMAQQDQHNNGPEHNEMQHNNQPNGHEETHNAPSHNSSEHSELQHGNPPNERIENHGAPSMQHASSRQWRNGDHYTGNRTVVNNWSHYHLRQPPSGYEWVQDSDQLVLIAITSGVIASVIASQ